MKHSIKAAIVVLLFLPLSFASAAFGISPIYFYNEALYPGQEYEKTINLLRSDSPPAETATIEYKIPGISGWFSADIPNPVILPAGQVRTKVKIKVKIPSGARAGEYHGKINIYLGRGTVPGNNVVLGVAIDANIKVKNKINLGSILLQVEKKGEAWYIGPVDGKKYYLGNPDGAFKAMKKLGIGARHINLTKGSGFEEQFLGKIFIDVDDHGKAYYINPNDKKSYYLGRPSDAFRIMTRLGIGATDKFLDGIQTGSIEN